MQHDVGLKVYELRRRRYIASKLRRWRLGLTRIPEQPDTLDLEDDEFVTLPLEGRLTFAYSNLTVSLRAAQFYPLINRMMIMTVVVNYQSMRRKRSLFI